MLSHASASLRTGIVRLVVVSALLIACFAIATGTASAHSNSSNGNHYGHDHSHSSGSHSGHHHGHGHSWSWSWKHGHCQTKPTPTASFTAVPAATFVGESVEFDASASTGGTTNTKWSDPVAGKITKYDWAFGDGATATGETATASHAYAEPGTYDVKLTVTNDAARTASLTKTVVVSALPVPTAAIARDTELPLATHVVQFDGSGSTGGESAGRVGTIVAYDWSFGDEATATGATASHTFAAAGSYVVSLTVTNDAGKTDTATQTVEVAPLPNPIPTAAFTQSPVAPVAERVVTYDASTSTGGITPDLTGSIVSYAWNFGDGETSTGSAAIVDHVFAVGGTFEVTLTVTNDYGQTASASRTVEVAPAPPPYDPGDGPTSTFDAAEPFSVSPLAPQSLVTSSKAGGTVKVGFSVEFALPEGSDPAEACNGNGSVAVSAARLKKVNGKSSLAASGDGCQLRFKLSLPKGYAGKKAKFAFAFAGNDSVAPWALTRKLSVK